MYAGQVVISVWNCRAAVSRYVKEQGGLALDPASNWQDLEDEAIAEVEGQGGAVNLSGHYTCSSELAAKATFS